MERNVIKVESARMVGRATDLSLSGTINLQQKNPLDLRVNGKFDLASLQDFNHDIYGIGRSSKPASPFAARWRNRRSPAAWISRTPPSTWPNFRWRYRTPTA